MIRFLVCGVNPRRRADEAYRDSSVGRVQRRGGAGRGARLMKEERRRAEALAELDRAKTAFFSNVSHEFRTPLTLMLGPLGGRCSPARAAARPDARALELVHRNALRLLKLVNTLLDFSRIEAGRVAGHLRADGPRRAPRLSSPALPLGRSRRAGLALRVDCPPLREPVYVDREMWEKIVLNLALQRVQVHLRGRHRGRAAARRRDARAVGARHRHRASPPRSCRASSSASTASGRAGRTHEGTGIGLALVQEMASCTAARSSVESARARAAPSPSPPAGRAPSAAPSGSAPRGTVPSTARGRRPRRGGAALAAGRRPAPEARARRAASPRRTPRAASLRRRRQRRHARLRAPAARASATTSRRWPTARRRSRRSRREPPGSGPDRRDDAGARRLGLLRALRADPAPRAAGHPAVGARRRGGRIEG